MGRTVGAGAARAAVVSSGSKFRFISGSGSLCWDFLSVARLSRSVRYVQYGAVRVVCKVQGRPVSGVWQGLDTCTVGNTTLTASEWVSTSRDFLKHRLHVWCQGTALPHLSVWGSCSSRPCCSWRRSGRCGGPPSWPAPGAAASRQPGPQPRSPPWPGRLGTAVHSPDYHRHDIITWGYGLVVAICPEVLRGGKSLRFTFQGDIGSQLHPPHPGVAAVHHGGNWKQGAGSEQQPGQVRGLELQTIIRRCFHNHGGSPY